MAASMYVMYGISALSIVLGFIAVLKQKTYVDPATNQPTEVELPFFGKLKTNVPALALVFLGLGVAYLVFTKSLGTKEEWRITGSLVAPGSAPNWAAGSFVVFPTDVQVDVSPQGAFEIRAWLPKGEDFEEAVESIDYTHTLGSVQVDWAREYERYQQGDTASVIASAGSRVRRLKPLMITTF